MHLSLDMHFPGGTLTFGFVKKKKKIASRACYGFITRRAVGIEAVSNGGHKTRLNMIS